MRSAYSVRGMDDLMAGQGLVTRENFGLKDLEAPLRAELGALPFAIPGMFGLGIFQVTGGSPVSGPSGRL